MTQSGAIAIVCTLVVGYVAASRLWSSQRERWAMRARRRAAASALAWTPVTTGYVEGNWFVILGVSRAASREQVTAAYKRKICQYSPERIAILREPERSEAEQRASHIDAAYEHFLRRLQ